MAETEPAILDLRTATGEELVRVMNLGVRDGLLNHKDAGQLLVTWDYATERIIMVPPEEIGDLDLERK